MRSYLTTLLLFTALWALTAAESTTPPPEDATETPPPPVPSKPTLLAIILPSIDPVQAVENSLEVEEGNFQDVVEEEEDEDDDEDLLPEEGEILKTARNIVFRPLFSYRQTKVAKRRAQARRSAARKSSSARRGAQKRNAQSTRKYYRPSGYYRPRYSSYYPSYYYNAQFPTIA